MKFYETSDVTFYVDIPNKWDLYCQYDANKTWEYRPINNGGCINCYRDYEGAWMSPQFTRQAYYLKNEKWHNNRIKPWACLPVFYAKGHRFIKLTTAPPVNYKCAEFPLTLKETLAIMAKMELEAEIKEKEDRLKKAFERECQKKSKTKSRKKGKKSK